MSEKVEVFVTVRLKNGEEHYPSFKLEGTVTETVEKWMERFCKEDGYYTYIDKENVYAFKYKDVVSIKANLMKENTGFTLSDIAEEINRNFQRWNNPDRYQ